MDTLKANGELPADSVPPCPFCGCDRIGAGQYGDVYMVYCGNGECSARVLDKNREKAIRRWSRRPTSAWVESGIVMAEADRLEQLIRLKMESGASRQQALEWALEMRKVYGVEPSPT